MLNDEARDMLEKLELEEDITSFYTFNALKTVKLKLNWLNRLEERNISQGFYFYGFYSF